jgi:DNA polymerase-3 subunit alpha
MLADVKPIVTKKGDRMAIVQMEDLSGQAEGVVFPKNYESISSLIQADARLIVWGKVDRRDEQTQLIIEDAEPIEQVQMVIVELTPQRISKGELIHLRTILQDHSGQKNQAKIPVLATVAASNQHQFVRFDSKYWVQDCTAAVNALKAAGFLARPSVLTW